MAAGLGEVDLSSRAPREQTALDRCSEDERRRDASILGAPRPRGTATQQPQLDRSLRPRLHRRPVIRSTSRQYTRPKCSPPISENSTTGARRTTRCSDSTAPSSLWPCHASHPSSSTTRPAPDALDRLSGVTRRARSAGRLLFVGPPERSVAPIAVASASRAPAPPMQVRCSRAKAELGREPAKALRSTGAQYDEGGIDGVRSAGDALDRHVPPR